MPSTVGAVLRLLGNIEEVQIFIKYRKLLKDQPWNHSFKDKYDIALAKVQTKVLKKHSTETFIRRQIINNYGRQTTQILENGCFLKNNMTLF